jgi:dihydroorotate dehydrogenase (fumarate)
MDDAGVNGFVLFNKLFQPEINVDEEKHITPWNLSEANDKRLPLRFTGLLYNKIKANICSSMGIFEGKDVAAMILAGADAVQVVSALYRFKPEHITKMLSDLQEWMEKKGYAQALMISVANFQPTHSTILLFTSVHNMLMHY